MADERKLVSMNDNRLGAVALIVGAITNVLVLTFHPGGGGGHELRVTQAQFEMLIAVVIGVHVLAISGLPFSFLGATALSRKIDLPNRLALLALVIYAFSLVAIMVAASMSGLVTPVLLRRLAAHGPDADQWGLLVHYTHTINQSFAQIAVVGSCIAIILWSLLMIKRRVFSVPLGIYGLLLGLVIVTCLFAGKLDLELHGFRLITLTQSIWFLIAGVLLWRSPNVPANTLNFREPLAEENVSFAAKGVS
jgi:hypothetical protein